MLNSSKSTLRLLTMTKFINDPLSIIIISVYYILKDNIIIAINPDRLYNSKYSIVKLI